MTLRYSLGLALGVLAALGGVEVERVDVADKSSIEALRRRLDGRVFDLLFVNAGIHGPRPQDAARAGDDEIARLFLTNAISPVRLARLIVNTPGEQERAYVVSTRHLRLGTSPTNDIVLVDPHEAFTVRAADSESGQGYSPFEGQELTGRVKSTFLRGALVYQAGKIVGPARGRYLRRPVK